MEKEKNELVYRSAISKMIETYTNMVVTTFDKVQLQVDDYQKQCVANMITKMDEVLRMKKMDFKQINPSNLSSILYRCAALRLNVASVPNECYISMRGDQFEFGIEGNGYESIMRRFGVGIKKIYSAWLVREGDGFSFPEFNGLELTPPRWQPKSFTKKVFMVVYPIEKTDGSQEYLFSSREDVARNLKAHISNNLLSDKALRAKIIEKINPMSLEEILEDKTLAQYISPSWKNAASSEQMIIRKMKNNALKNYPKDFRNSFVEERYEETYEDYDQYREQKEKREIDFTEKVENEVRQLEEVKDDREKIIPSRPKKEIEIVESKPVEKEQKVDEVPAAEQAIVEEEQVSFDTNDGLPF